MTKNENKIIDKFVEEIGADAVLLFDNNGKVIYSKNFDNVDSIGAMSNAIASMTQKFLEDALLETLSQITIKSSNSTIIMTKITDNYYSAVFAPKNINIGILLHKLESFNKNIFK